MAVQTKLAAPCGIHCGLCPMNLAIANEELRRNLAQRMGCPEDKVPCQGCRAVDGHCPVIGEQCATYICATEKKVEFCYECPEFPCVMLAPCSDRAGTLPHNLKVYSLSLLKAKGEAAWEEGIKKAWGLYYQGKMAIGRGPQPPEK